jgi:hypothetical protein
MFIHPRRSARYAFCCGHDRRPGHGVVLMIVDDPAEAETIGVEFRQTHIYLRVSGRRICLQNQEAGALSLRQ